jgi:hypothetical protein
LALNDFPRLENNMLCFRRNYSHGQHAREARALSSRSATLLFAVLLLPIVFSPAGLSQNPNSSSAHFSYARTNIGDGLGSATGITVDSKDNVFYFDTANRLVKASPLSNGSYTFTVLATGVSAQG